VLLGFSLVFFLYSWSSFSVYARPGWSLIRITMDRSGRVSVGLCFSSEKFQWEKVFFLLHLLLFLLRRENNNNNNRPTNERVVLFDGSLAPADAANVRVTTPPLPARQFPWHYPIACINNRSLPLHCCKKDCYEPTQLPLTADTIKCVIFE